jgi:hypothetical protein
MKGIAIKNVWIFLIRSSVDAFGINAFIIHRALSAR